MSVKKCINCAIEKEITFYYKHKQMGDGYLNKCIDCCKSQERERTRKLTLDSDWMEKQRERGREKYKRLNYIEKHKQSIIIYPWKNTNIYKGLRNWYESRNGFLDRSIELHHWSYLDENMRDIILLNRSTHKRVHSMLTIDIEKRCYFVSETKELLDTKEKHLNFIKSLNL
jgi:DNA-dependent RNA polymerase auxiliary subunit epsilon